MPEELLLDEPLLGDTLGEAVDVVAARACPTPTPPSKVPAAMVDATTARRTVNVTFEITSFRPTVSVGSVVGGRSATSRRGFRIPWGVHGRQQSSGSWESAQSERRESGGSHRRIPSTLPAPAQFPPRVASQAAGMNTALALAPRVSPVAPPLTADPLVEFVVPVFNEEADLERSIRRLRGYLDERFPFQAVVTIADNASTDTTWAIASRLAAELPGVRAIHLDAKGRGRALRSVWSSSRAEVVAYMDVDLSTGLEALLPLVAPLLSGHSDVAIGTRLARGSRVIRGPKREMISRAYNGLLRAILGTRFTDAQCGFKAMRADVARALIPLVEDQSWFFDTELLVLAERNGLRIHEVPVDWADDADSRVDVPRTAWEDLKGMGRLAIALAAGRGRAELPPSARPAEDWAELAPQVFMFAGIGAVSTVGYLAVFAVMWGPLGAFAANLVALAALSGVNFAANRRLTFSIRGRRGILRHALAAMVPLALSAVATTTALVAARALTAPSLGVDFLAVLVAGGAAALARFVLLRTWVFRHHRFAGSATLDGVGGREWR